MQHRFVDAHDTDTGILSSGRPHKARSQDRAPYSTRTENNRQRTRAKRDVTSVQVFEPCRPGPDWIAEPLGLRQGSSHLGKISDVTHTGRRL